MTRILTRSERRQMERAKEKHIAKLVAGGWNEFKDITNDAHTARVLTGMTLRPDQIFMNNLFVVQVHNEHCDWGPVKRVMIRRADAEPEHDWAIFQKIKNEIFGADCTALEVYPKERNKIDVANVYWLFVFPPEYQCPIERSRT